MKISQKIAAAFCGTSCMTAFSYGVSLISQSQFREPILLGHLLSSAPARPALYSTKKKAAAWLTHYGMGLLFAMTYRNEVIEGSKKAVGGKGLLRGAAFGFIGVTGWALAFKLHPNPPKIRKKSYLLHLIPAHLVFGSITALSARYFSGADKRGSLRG